MPFDEETLEDFREVMEDNLSDLCNVYRKQASVGVSDGMGGITYNIADSQGKDARTIVYSDVPCRVTVPRANRSDSEYTKNDVLVTESRAVLIFKHNEDIREGDRIDVQLRGKWRMFEVQVIADHSESYSLQANCVDLGIF